MKESIVLLGLGVCWAGYLAYYWRENRRTSHQRSDGIRAFSSGLGSLGGTASRSTVFTPSLPPLAPRSAVDAARRRREVALSLGVLAILSLFAAVAIGGMAIAVHIVIDLALGAYGYALVQRRNVEAEREMKVHMLYPEQAAAPAPVERQAVNV